MKRILLTITLVFSIGFVFGQATYYWVGGTTPTTSITTGSNWNTSLDGLGSPRPSSTGATDILVFDGSNVGGTSAATGPVTLLANGSITCGQIKFINNAHIIWTRATTGTSTITISGGAGDDFVIEAGSTMAVPPTTVGSLRFAMAATNTGVVSGTMSIITPLQFRFDNTVSGATGAFIFTSGSSFTTNITSASSSYAFGSGTQSSEKWVVFEDGAHLYYLGGYSPMGGTSTYSAIDFKPGSFWHHRANNGAGNFMARKSFGNIIVENNATLTADGPVYRINNLTVESGSSFITYTSGQTAIMGNLLVDGTLSSGTGSSNDFLFAGNSLQTVSGSGTISVANMIVGDNAHVELNTGIAVEEDIVINGRIDFNNHQLTGTADFLAEGIISPVNANVNQVAGAYQVSGNTGIPTSAKGKSISGAGIAPNTVVVSFSSTSDTVYISQPVISTATGNAVSITTSGATLETSHSNGFDPVNGSIAATGNKTYRNRINYIINAATLSPFGISTGSTASSVDLGYVIANADITTNTGVSVEDSFTVNAKVILRPLDTLHVLPGALLNGNFGSNAYVATGYDVITGDQGIVFYEGSASTIVLPIGTINHYLPVTIVPATASTFTAAVFQDITTNGAVTGTPLTPAQKQSVVNAVWNINRISGSGNADVEISWQSPLEGSTFTTLPSSEIGLIVNDGSSWSSPIGTGDNTINKVNAQVTEFGAFGIGALPPSQPFIFNPIPDKTYGDPDFNGGAVSLNTTQPIIYSSNNPSVATIVAGEIHIVGAGTASITASQASDGFYPSASVTQLLTVIKAPLVIKADDKLKFELQPNPALTATYTGFVLGETPAVLLTPAVLSTTAVTGSAPGVYPITVSGATSDNYEISFVNGVLTVQAKQNQVITFNALPLKTYGNAPFASGVTSTNSTIPVVLTSSNTSVATIVGTTIHIVGAGTSTITASQAGNEGYFPATDVTQVLTVNKVPLTIRVRDTTKIQGEPNPPFTITYTGFVLGETAANLTTPPVVATVADVNTSPGYYSLTPEGAVTQNYNITYIPGRLTILPRTGNTESYINVFMSNASTLTIRVFSVEPALGDITIFDMSGRPMAKKNLFMPVGFTTSNISVPWLPSGIYVITIRGNGVDLKKTIPIIK